MVYLETRKDITIDQLIKSLQKAKADLPAGGKTKVLMNVNDDYHSVGVISSDFAEGNYGYWEWTGYPEEAEEYERDEDAEDETVLSLVSL